jgi:hypothetical protein
MISSSSSIYKEILTLEKSSTKLTTYVAEVTCLSTLNLNQKLAIKAVYLTTKKFLVMYEMH